MRTNISKIVDLSKVGIPGRKIDFSEIAGYAKNDRTTAAKNDRVKVLLVGIDFQYCFMENVGSLGVGGSRADVRRTIEWLYNNWEKVTRVMVSADDHTMQQIFFPCWWSDKKGNEPDAYTIISYEDVKNGIWIPNYDKLINDERNPGKLVSYCEEYLRHLEEGGQQQLQIWPYHATSLTFDSNIEAELSAMVYYHARCRQSDPYIARKGTDPWTEMYSLIKPEWSLDGYINNPVLAEMCKYDIVIFTGEAASHCAGLSALHSVQELRARGNTHTRFVVFKDCMSPIGTYEEFTQNLYKKLESEYGVLVTDSTGFML